MAFVTVGSPLLRPSPAQRLSASRAVPYSPTRVARQRRVVPCAQSESVVAPSSNNAGVSEAAMPHLEGAYDPSGMTVDEFFAASCGDWRSQRSSHNLAWTQFEAITSDITITAKPIDDPEVVELYTSNDVDPADVVTSIEMSWEGESDWDDEEEVKGCVLMSVIKDTPNTGRLLRSQGYAEEIPAVGKWVMCDDGAFVVTTPYEAASAEERIWFATPDLRLRVSNIRTQSGKGVVTASFSSEIRSVSKE